MSEYKNGVNFRGNMSVEKSNVNADVRTGRAIFVDEDKYEKDSVYKAKVDKCLAEGFHRVGSSSDEGGGGGSSDFSTAQVTIAGLENNDELTVYGTFATTDEGGSYTMGGGSFLNGTYDFVLYKGQALIYAPTMEGMDNPVISGNYDENTQMATGNITITVTYL